MHFQPLDGGMLLGFPKLAACGPATLADPEIIQRRTDIGAVAAFQHELFGRAPDS